MFSLTVCPSAAVSFGFSGKSVLMMKTLGAYLRLSVFVETLPGDPGQPDAEPGFPAVTGHPGKHRAAGREDEVRSGLKTFCLLDSS